MKYRYTDCIEIDVEFRDTDLNRSKATGIRSKKTAID